MPADSILNAGSGRYLDEAETAFGEGRDADGLKYLYGHVLTNDEAAAAQKMYFVSGFRRPSMALLWGMGMMVSTPKDMRGGKLPKIGETPDGVPFPRAMKEKIDAYEKQKQTQPKGRFERAKGTNYTGDVGARFLERLDMRLNREYYGELLRQISNIPKSNNGFHTTTSGEERVDERALPGVLYFGKGTAKELMDKARKRGIDLLAVFDVRVKGIGRESASYNVEVKLRLMNVGDGRVIRETNSLNNIQVYRDRVDLKDVTKDPVDMMLDQIFVAIADKEYRVGEMPSLNADQVKGRIGQLLEQKDRDINPLRSLAEIRYYHTQKLLSDELLLVAYQRMLGDATGKALAEGKQIQKEQAISKFMPKKEAGTTNSSGGDFR